jgi:pimeloyl-ACP methyl ester carboxylesterase
LHPAADFLQELTLLKFNKEGKMEKQEIYGRHDSVLTAEQISGYAGIPTKYIEVEGVNYAYRSLGVPSDVPIICLQHFIGTLDNWDPVIMNGLAAERKVITINNTGIGNSGGETPDDVLDMSRDVIKIITALGITKCDLLGFSLGGFIAQTIADIKPDLLRKIIMVGTAPQGAKALYSFPQLAGKALAMDPVERFLFIFATKSEKSRTKVRAALDRLLTREQDRDKEISLSAIQAQIKALTRWGTDPPTINLSKIDQPVLIIQGSHDEMMDSATSLELFKQIPNSVLSYYPDSAHGSFFQYPEFFVDQANSFLNTFE